MTEQKQRCDVAYCRRKATHVTEWESEQGGTRKALRCQIHALPTDKSLRDAAESEDT